MSTALLKPRDIAEQFGVSVDWVHKHASGKRQPVMPSVKMGKTLRFRPEDVAAFVAKWSREAC